MIKEVLRNSSNMNRWPATAGHRLLWGGSEQQHPGHRAESWNPFMVHDRDEPP